MLVLVLACEELLGAGVEVLDVLAATDVVLLDEEDGMADVLELLDHAFAAVVLLVTIVVVAAVVDDVAAHGIPSKLLHET